MNETVKELVTAMLQKDAIGTENAFQNAMAEKITAKLDDMRVQVAQNMFVSNPTPVEDPMITAESVETMTEEQLDEVITSKTPTSAVIKDFVHSDDPRFEGKSKKERIKMALGAYYAKHPEKSNK
jgi:hypothetical protein